MKSVDRLVAANDDAKGVTAAFHKNVLTVVNRSLDGDFDVEVAFGRGEQMRTEISAKFRRAGVAADLAAAGHRLEHWWSDPAGDFALSLSVPVPGGVKGPA